MLREIYPAPSGAGGPPRIQMIAQYVKDLSFENPGAPGLASTQYGIEMGVDLQARRTEDQNFEVELKLRIDAKTAEDKQVFLLELAYAGLLQIVNVPEEVMQQILLIEAPSLLFPFARRIIADSVRDGGLPPLMLGPIDFAGLFRARVEQQQQVRAPSSGNA